MSAYFPSALCYRFSFAHAALSQAASPSVVFAPSWAPPFSRRSLPLPPGVPNGCSGSPLSTLLAGLSARASFRCASSPVLSHSRLSLAGFLCLFAAVCTCAAMLLCSQVVSVGPDPLGFLAYLQCSPPHHFSVLPSPLPPIGPPGCWPIGPLTFCLAAPVLCRSGFVHDSLCAFRLVCLSCSYGFRRCTPRFSCKWLSPAPFLPSPGVLRSGGELLPLPPIPLSLSGFPITPLRRRAHLFSAWRCESPTSGARAGPPPRCLGFVTGAPSQQFPWSITSPG